MVCFGDEFPVRMYVSALKIVTVRVQASPLPRQAEVTVL